MRFEMTGRAVRALVAMLFSAVVWGAQAASPELEKAISADNPTTTALGVVQAKEQAKSGEKVTVEGKVKDFVEGQAVFTLADTKLKSCKDNGESCPTPWDYCCNSKSEISRNVATVKVVGVAGSKQAIKAGVKGVKGIDHLVTVSAEGTAQKDAAGNLTILAEKIHVKK